MKVVTNDELREFAKNHSARNISSLCKNLHWRKIELWQAGQTKLMEEDLKKVAKVLDFGT